MPYILLKRNDIPAGFLQTLDLQPNTSQRRFPYQKVGQTGYRDPVVNGTTTVVAGVSGAAVTGLTAYFLGSLSDEAGANAAATITTVAVAALVDGDFFTLSDGVVTEVFEFNVSGNHVVTPGRVEVDVSGDVTAADVRDTLIVSIPASDLDVTAAIGGAAAVGLTNNNQNQATASQNATNSENVANVGFLVPSFAAAGNSATLTPAAAAVNAGDVLTLLSYGALLTPAGALTLAAINGALTTGSLNKAQLADVLDILAGRPFTIPAGSTVGTIEFIPSGSFTSAGIRRIYETGALRISFDSGRLSLEIDNAFEYGGNAGAAVAVYNDDGSLFT